VAGGERSAGKLLREPGLADPRLADEKYEPARSVRNICECRSQHRKFAGPTDESIGAARLAR
jgi:hypothetical protein